MTTIYLVRHAEAEGNLYRRAQGQFNSHLTPFGYKQLEKLAERFKDIDVDKVYASDLNRAFLTGKCIADIKNLPITKSEKLREIHMGVFEDVAWAELPNLYPEIYEKWSVKPHECELAEGESPLISGDRLYDEVLKIANENQGKNIVIATHGAVIRYFLHKVIKKPLSDLEAIGWSDNTSVAKLSYTHGEFNLEYKNDAKHLEGMKNPFVSKLWFDMTEEELLKGTQFWFKPVDIDNDFEKICEYVAGINEIAYKTNEHFNKNAFFDECKKITAINPRSIVFAMLGEEVSGLCQADLLKSTDNIGFIGNIIIDEKYRGMGFAPQIIGEIASFYRKINKEYLGVVVAKENHRAKAFYNKIGFVAKEDVMENGYEHTIMLLNLVV